MASLQPPAKLEVAPDSNRYSTASTASCEDGSRIATIRQRLDETDAEIVGTLAHLERLRKRRCDIFADLNAATAPIMSLPPELLCEIFLHCLPPGPVLPNTKYAPLLLGQICRQWRDVALLTPMLWSSISVASVLSSFLRPGVLPQLQTWLDRATSCSLSVSLTPENDPNEFMLTSPNAVFRQIRHTSHRWRELFVVRPLQDFPIILHRDAPWNLPELFKLTLLFTDVGRPSSGSSAVPFLSNLIEAPCLREVHLMGLTPSTLLLPWSQLTTLHAENLHPSECIITLTHTTSLISGTFSLWPAMFFHITASTPLACLPLLKSLTISGNLCTEILDHFQFPALSQFTIGFGPNNDFAPLTSFLTRTPTLRVVSVQAKAAVTAGDFIGCLDAMPHVETLAFALDNGLTNGILPGVLQNAAVLSQLRVLTIQEKIDRYNEGPVNETALVDMLCTRWKAPGGGLKSFHLITTHAFREIDPRFIALTQEGMKIDLRSHGSGPFLTVYFNKDRLALGLVKREIPTHVSP